MVREGVAAFIQFRCIGICSCYYFRVLIFRLSTNTFKFASGITEIHGSEIVYSPVTKV